MINRVELKAKAKEFAFNNKWNIWKGILLCSIVSGAVSTVSEMLAGAVGGEEGNIISALIILIGGIAVMPLEIGLVDYFVKLVRKKDVDLTESLFKYYKKEYLWNTLKIVIVANLIIFALSLLLIIPGIIWALKYAMISFLIVDKSAKDLEKDNLRKESESMMDGHKWEYVVLQLSFILWGLLVSVTCGIAAIWVVPYVTVTNVMWFDELKKLSK